jgi:hypothetical protein
MAISDWFAIGTISAWCVRSITWLLGLRLVVAAGRDLATPPRTRRHQGLRLPSLRSAGGRRW